MAGGKIDAITPAMLSRAAGQGDEFAREQYRAAGYALGAGIVNTLHIFNPERIVIGGGVWLHCRPLLEEAMWEAIRERSEAPAYYEELEIVTVALGENVGLLGAVALAVDGLRRGRMQIRADSRDGRRFALVWQMVADLSCLVDADVGHHCRVTTVGLGAIAARGRVAVSACARSPSGRGNYGGTSFWAGRRFALIWLIRTDVLAYGVLVSRVLTK